ncbi:MAG: TonB-dependent receptor, partial [Muribaculaceae bacterium]|nr:TonB-dependent receptor [Muribaculaceae bacterium]
MEKRIEHCRTRFFRLAMTIVCLLANIGIATAAPITVKGTVTSAVDGEPLIGATVFVKGTSTGAATDVDGNYTIQTEIGAVLQFSYVGMRTRTATVTSARLDIALLEDDSVLDDLVVVGYGVQKKKLLTGATAQIEGSEIAKMNTTSPLQAMQGQMPGVNISSTSGQPGSGMKVTIRGLGTIGNSSPLYLIDGVGGDISTLNPNDIESIDVLKDGASAAIYGAQAANGVVLITTKKGKEGRTKITFDGYYGIQNVARKVNLLNSREYMTIMDEQQINEGLAPYDWASFSSIYNADGSLVDTDWMGQMFKDDAAMQSYAIGISGGNANSNYLMSLGYLNQEGIVGGKEVSDYSRYNFRINSDHKAFNGILSFGEQVSFVYVKSTGIGVGNQYNNTLRGAFGMNPLTPVYDAEGNYFNTTGTDWYQFGGNPYGSMMTCTNNRSISTTFSGNVYAQLEPVKNLRLRTQFGTVYGSSKYRSFGPIYEFSPYSYSTQTTVSQNMNQSLGMTWTNTLSYDFDIKEHSFNALIGMEAYRYSGEYIGGGQIKLKEGFDDWEHAYISNGTGSSLADPGMGLSGHPHDDARSVSYFGRLGWDWKEKYMVNVTLRSDGSSHFARGHRFGWFPSASAGWNISSEEFMEATHGWLDFFKIRASWARVGNQNINNYQYLAPIKNTNTHYFFGQYIGPNGQLNDGYGDILATNWGAYPSRLGNLDVTWETSEQTNIGFDARLFGSRLGINFDWYVKTNKDWLVVAPILATAGTDAPFINGGDVKNTGVELGLTWNDTFGNDFSYSISLNGAYNKNKVGSIPTEDGMIHGNTNELYDNALEFYRAQNGMPIGYFWGYKTDGIFQNQKEIDDWIAAGNGVLQANPQPGDVRYVDVNKDNIINDEDKVDLGNGMPKFNYGFNINLYWKNFDLGITANGVAGNKIVQSYRNQGNQYQNYTTAILDRWTGEGTSNRMPRVSNQNINWQFSDLYIQDGDFLRISNLTLGYDFAPLINQNWLSQCRIYAQVQNLLTFTKYDGMDPEIGYGTSDWVS